MDIKVDKFPSLLSPITDPEPVRLTLTQRILF